MELQSIGVLIEGMSVGSLGALVDRFCIGLKATGLTIGEPVIALGRSGVQVMAELVEPTVLLPDVLPGLALGFSDVVAPGGRVSMVGVYQEWPVFLRTSPSHLMLNTVAAGPVEWFQLDRNADGEVNARRVFLVPTGQAVVTGGVEAVAVVAGWFAALGFEYGLGQWSEMSVEFLIREVDGWGPSDFRVAADFTDPVIGSWEYANVTMDEVVGSPWGYALTCSAAIGAIAGAK